MSIAATAPSRRLRTTLAAAGLAVAATAGLGFSALGAAHAADTVHVKITVTSNSVPESNTPTVLFRANGNQTCDPNAGATPTVEFDVPKDSKIQVYGMAACYSTMGGITEVSVGDGGDFTVAV
jgi:hypothetical protein